eukprot:749834-Amphidinium_carterae.1
MITEQGNINNDSLGGCLGSAENTSEEVSVLQVVLTGGRQSQAKQCSSLLPCLQASFGAWIVSKLPHHELGGPVWHQPFRGRFHLRITPQTRQEWIFFTSFASVLPFLCVFWGTSCGSQTSAREAPGTIQEAVATHEQYVMPSSAQSITQALLNGVKYVCCVLARMWGQTFFATEAVDSYV